MEIIIPTYDFLAVQYSDHMTAQEQPLVHYLEEDNDVNFAYLYSSKHQIPDSSSLATAEHFSRLQMTPAVKNLLAARTHNP